ASLRSTEQADVVQQGDALAIEPASPQVVYVPYYDPRVAYGSWWWPAYPPVYWAPWPGYYVYPGFVFAWGGGISVGSGFFFISCDWRARHVTIVNVTNVFVNRSGVVNRPAPVRTGQPVVWQHDPGHRRGVPYHIATLQHRLGASTQAGQRRDFRWQEPVVPASRNGSLNRPEVHDAHLRQNPRGPDDGRAGRHDGRSNFSPNPGVVRREVRPELGVSRPPVAPAPQAHAGPGNVPRMQSLAPLPAPVHNPQAQGFAGRAQAGMRPAPSVNRAHGEGHNR